MRASSSVPALVQAREPVAGTSSGGAQARQRVVRTNAANAPGTSRYDPTLFDYVQVSTVSYVCPERTVILTVVASFRRARE